MDGFFQQVSHLFARADWLSPVDIIILIALFYGLLTVLQGTRAAVLVRGLLILFGFALLVVIFNLPLPVLKWLVSNSLQFIIFAVIVVFAPELRRTLEQIGHTGDFINRPLANRSQDTTRLMIDEVVAAAFYLSGQRWGGLMVVERETGLQDLANKGVPINGQVSFQLLGNLFVPNTPLHDGAVLIRQDQVVAAKVILPLSENISRQEHFGTRHKAALGISEQSDAIIVVVSEETGLVSVAHNGKLTTKLDRDRLRQMLRSLLEPNNGKAGRRNGRAKPVTSKTDQAKAGEKELKTLKTNNGSEKPKETEKEAVSPGEKR